MGYNMKTIKCNDNYKVQELRESEFINMHLRRVDVSWPLFCTLCIVFLWLVQNMLL